MKQVTALIILSCFALCFKAAAQGITISEKNVSLEKIFSIIKKQTDYSFFYSDNDINKGKPVSIELKNAAIVTVLEACFKDQPLTYSILGKTIVVKLKENKVVDDNERTNLIDISGRVVDDSAKAVENVAIKVKGANKGTFSNSNGEYALRGIDPVSTLIFTHINLQTREVHVNGNKEINVTLKAKIIELPEFQSKTVNTGYQNIKSERFVGSAVVVDSATFNRTITTDILSRLDGVTTSLIFLDKNLSGQPPNIQIRGISTIPGSGTPTQPLIIVDNFPFYGDLNSINPNDVESVTILKDAAAASVWGAQAGNGVIVITTKKGKYNQPFKLTASTSFRITEKPDLFRYPQMSTSDFIDVESFLFNQGKYDADLSNTSTWPIVSPVVEILAKARSGGITQSEAESQIDALRSLDVRNDYKKFVFATPISRQDYLNFTGGTSILRYALSLGADQNQSNYKNDAGYSRYSLNNSTSFKVSKIFEMTFDLGLTHAETRSGSSLEYPSSVGDRQMYPYAQLADANGKHLTLPRRYRAGFVDTVAIGKLLDWHYRPLDELKLADNIKKDLSLRLNLGAKVRFTSWLDAGVSVGYVSQKSESRDLSSPESFFTRDLINRYTQIIGNVIKRPIPLGGILNLGKSEGIASNLRGQVNINKSWGVRHSITALVAAEISENKSNSYSTRLYGYNDELGTFSNIIDYISDFPLFVGSSTAKIPNQDRYIEGNINRAASFLTNVSYSLLERYRLYISMRKDGANIFGAATNNKWKPLFSIGLSWDISKEQVFNNSKISSLAFRVSYGTTGNSNNTVTPLTAMYYSNTNSIYTQTPFAYVSPANPNLRWEKVSTFNLGLDFSLFKGRISGSLEWYRKVSTDIIAGAYMDPTLGLGSAGNLIPKNFAGLKGKGIDISLQSNNINGKNFKWSSSLNFSNNKTIIVKFHSVSPSVYMGYGGINAREGTMAYGFYSYRWAGLDPLTGDPLGYLKGQASKDYVGLMTDSIQHNVFHGSSIPLYFGNIVNSFSYKGFAISFNVTGKFGYYFRKTSISYNSLVNNWKGHIEYANRWRKTGDEHWTSVPSFVYGNVVGRDQFYAGSEVNVERADHIRLENLVFTLPPWINKRRNKVPVQSFQFSFQPASLNMILWRANKWKLDPDFESGSSFLLPPPKVWAVRIEIKFK